jgi:hypothetical protein
MFQLSKLKKAVLMYLFFCVVSANAGLERHRGSSNRNAKNRIILYLEYEAAL